MSSLYFCQCLFVLLDILRFTIIMNVVILVFVYALLKFNARNVQYRNIRIKTIKNIFIDRHYFLNINKSEKKLCNLTIF